jgi:hypothetical protein
MIALVSIPHPRIDAQVNVASHFQRLASLLLARLSDEHVALEVRGRRDFGRLLTRSPLRFLYLLGHSDRAGFRWENGGALGADTLLRALAGVAFSEHAVAWLSTCDASASGLLAAVQRLGPAAVVAADAPIPVAASCAYVEEAATAWEDGPAFLAPVLERLNGRFQSSGVTFRVERA